MVKDPVIHLCTYSDHVSGTQEDQGTVSRHHSNRSILAKQAMVLDLSEDVSIAFLEIMLSDIQISSALDCL